MPRSICTVEGCDRFVNGHGFCVTHYDRWRKYGDPLKGRQLHAPPEERFWRFVTKGADDECWLFRARGNARYGRFQLQGRGGKHVGAHRFSYEMHHGPIPDGMVVMHKCDTPLCVNPGHLTVGTPKQNTRDMICKNRHARVAPKGEASPWAVLTEDDVREIRASSEKNAALAKRYGIGKTTLRAVRSRKTWRHIQ